MRNLFEELRVVYGLIKMLWRIRSKLARSPKAKNLIVTTLTLLGKRL
jgi:hypothetical protein